jgi:TRAP-type C4-dicarboxylate transport system permease small subunit
MQSRKTNGPAPLRGALGLIGRGVGALAQGAMALSALGVLVSLGLIVYSVVLRYAFNRPPVWVDDVVGFLLVGTVMLAAAHTLRMGEHIGVDILTERLGPRGRRWAEAWGMAAVVVVSLILIVNGWNTAMFSKMLGILTAGEVEAPLYLLQLLLPLGGLLMLLVALEALLRLALGAPPLVDAPTQAGSDAADAP